MKKVLFLLLTLMYQMTSAQEGALDMTFNSSDKGWGYGDGGDARIVSVLSDGKLMVYGTNYNFSPINLARILTDGTIDPSFNPGGSGIQLGDVRKLIVRTDGKMYIAGTFTNYNGIVANKILLLNSDGTKNLSFNPGTGPNADIYSMAIQADGKIIISGNFTAYNGVAINHIARINIDGTLDMTFNPNSGPDSAPYCLYVQPDGKILIGGNFQMYNVTTIYCRARLNSDGSLDNSFSGGMEQSLFTKIEPLADGKFLFSGSSYGALIINPNGTVFSNLNGGNNGDNINSTAVQDDGKIIVTGDFLTYLGNPHNRMVRLNSDLTIDNSFNTGIGPDSQVSGVNLLDDGKIMVFSSGLFGGKYSTGLRRLNTDGTLDTSFNTGSGANERVSELLIQPDGKILIGGYFRMFNGELRNNFARLTSSGELDPAFNIGNGFNNPISSISQQPDGKIMVTGGFTQYNNLSRFHIARLNQDGSDDPTFIGPTSDLNTPLTCTAAVDGKIYVGGQANYPWNNLTNFINRLNTDGSPDPSFVPPHSALLTLGFNQINIIRIQENGKVLIVHSGLGVLRLNTNGTLDDTFTMGTGLDSGWISSIYIQPDGKVLFGGTFTHYNGIPVHNMARLNSDGTVDISFDCGTGPNGNILAMHSNPDGTILVGGDFTSFNGIPKFNLTKLNADGSLDLTYNEGIAGANSSVWSIALQADAKPIIGGWFSVYNGIGRNRITRLNGITLDTQENIADENIMVFPNPTESVLNIKIPENSEISELSIRDLTGKMMLSQKTILNSVDISQLTSGIYILSVASTEGVLNTKFIKR